MKNKTNTSKCRLSLFRWISASLRLHFTYIMAKNNRFI